MSFIIFYYDIIDVKYLIIVDGKENIDDFCFYEDCIIGIRLIKVLEKLKICVGVESSIDYFLDWEMMGLWFIYGG